MSDHPLTGRSQPLIERLPEPGTLAIPAGPQIWWARVDVGNLRPQSRAALAADVDAVRLARLERFRRAADSDRGLAAHALLRRLLAGITGGAPSTIVLRTRCASCGATEHGKPYLDAGTAEPPVEINLTHSGELVCVALAPAGVPVGVDVEHRRTMDWPTLRPRIFADVEWQTIGALSDPTDRERRLMDAWARKESSVKACGHGISMPMNQVVITDADDGSWSATLPEGAGSTAGWDLGLPDDVASAVAVHNGVMPTRPDVHQVSLD